VVDQVRNLLKILGASLAIAAATPAAAQYVFTPPAQLRRQQEAEALARQQPILTHPLWNNVVRVNVGVGFFYSDYYNCGYWYGFYPTFTCGSGSFVSYIPFAVGPQIDLNLQGMNNISVGFNVFLGTATGTV